MVVLRNILRLGTLRLCRSVTNNSTLYANEANNSYISALEEWVQDQEPVTFNPLSINLSPGSLGRSNRRSAALIDVYPYATDNQGNVVSQVDLKDRKVKESQTYSIQLDQLYPVAYEALKSVCQLGVMPLPAPVGVGYPIAALLMLLAQGGIHQLERSLLKLNREYTPQAKMMSEGEISAILANHLVSQLIGPPSNYMVSNDVTGKTRLCPCGCFTEITYGNTNFGTKELWYGKPDIVASTCSGGIVNVVLQREAEGEFNEVPELNDDEKHIKEDKSSCSCLDAIENVGDIMLQTILYAFYQKVFQAKQNISDSDVVSLIPTVALCPEEAHIYMYDTKYDILLKNSSPLPFWNEETDSLNLNTLITLWMTFYHLDFRPHFPGIAVDILQGSSGFQESVGIDQLEQIEKSITMEKKTYGENYNLNHTLPMIENVIPIR